MKNLMIKNLFPSLFSICFFLIFANSVTKAQNDEHIYVVVNWLTVMPDDGTAAERDSLLSEWVEDVLKKNDKILSSKNLRHYFGDDSRDWVVINEFASLAEMEEAGKINTELAKKKWPDDKERSEFFRKLTKYFPRHSDEIFNGLPKFDK